MKSELEIVKRQKLRRLFNLFIIKLLCLIVLEKVIINVIKPSTRFIYSVSIVFEGRLDCSSTLIM